MLYKDRLREKDFLKLATQRGVCLSIFLPTSPLTQEAQADRITLKNLSKMALERAEPIADKRQLAAMTAELEELQADDMFWKYQAHGLAVFVTPESIRTYRLTYPVAEAAEVSDRFYLKPLLPALRPATAYVLAISQKNVTLYEFTPAKELEPVALPDLPADFSAVTGRTLQRDRAPAGRIQGDEGERILQTQFLRAVEQAVRPAVSASGMPLILATTTHLQAIYRSLNNYELLTDQAVDGSVEKVDVEELRQAVIPLVAALRQERIQAWVERFQQRASEARTSTSIAEIAKFAARGQVSDLLVNADAVQYGTISDTGRITTEHEHSAENYDLLDELVVRVLDNGGDVLAVRQDEETPAELTPIAAILRWA